jgi:hypothetical protein
MIKQKVKLFEQEKQNNKTILFRKGIHIPKGKYSFGKKFRVNAGYSFITLSH